MLPEIIPDCLVAVVTQHLPDDLHRDHLAIAQARSKPTGTQFHPGGDRLKALVYSTTVSYTHLDVYKRQILGRPVFSEQDHPLAVPNIVRAQMRI